MSPWISWISAHGNNAYVGEDPVNGRDPMGLWLTSGHEDLTRKACEDAGLCKGCCDVIVAANVETDGSWYWDGVKWQLGKNTRDEDVKHHMMSGINPDGTFTSSPERGHSNRVDARQRWAEYGRKTLSDAANSAKECECLEALNKIGTALHSFQDSFAHQVLDENINKGLPISDDEHREDFFTGHYDDPKYMPSRYDSAQVWSNYFMIREKDVLGCCCSGKMASGQEPCQSLCN